MDIRIVRLLNGEDLLGEVVVNEVVGELMIKNPVRIVVMPNKIDPKTPNVGFAPWAEFSEQKEFKLDMSHVVAIMRPIKEFVAQYNNMFSKIVTPQASGLIIPS
jgi:hypothetical protein